MMQIGEVIRKYRKEKNLTQEEMARRLGVTAPAVNKWENGNSMPDIAFLAPIARLLDVSLDTLLDFQDHLSPEEIRNIIQELDDRMDNGTYDEAFSWAKKILEKYPNCDQLVWQIAVVLNAGCILMGAEAEKYEPYIMDCLRRALNSSDETARTNAADSLFSFYMRKEQYEEAEKYLEYFSVQNPERKRKQAYIYSKTHRREEAFKAYEELLISVYGMANLTFGCMLCLYEEEQDMEKAHFITDRIDDLAGAFAMGRYQGVASKLELAVLEKDAETAFSVMEELLESAGHILDYCDSPLYSHIEFRKDGMEEFAGKLKADLKEKLREMLRNEESYGFLKGDPRLEELL